MSERRSGRSRKQIDYATFEADNDDDFADPTPPPPKKKKTSEKTEGRKEKDQDKPPKLTSSERPAGRKARVPLDEKLYERDLQAALEMSLEASQSQKDEDNKSSTTVNGDAILHSTPRVASDCTLDKTDMPLESQCIMPSAIPQGVAADNDIEFLGTVTCSDTDSPPSKPRAASKKKKYTFDEDESSGSEDFSDGGSESDSDFNEADSDFDDGKTSSKSKKKGKAASAKTKPVAASVKNRPSASKSDNKAKPTVMTSKPSVVQKKPAASVKNTGGEVRASTSVATNPTSGKVAHVSHRAPAWTPPGCSGGGSSNSVSLKSPSSGLRLGLSRHARIKPLHPSLKVS